MVRVEGVELRFSRLPRPFVGRSRWGGVSEGRDVVMKTKSNWGGKRPPFEEFLTVRIFSQQSFCKTTSRAKRRDILACRRTDIVVLEATNEERLKRRNPFFTLLFLESVCFLPLYILFIMTIMQGRSMSFLR